MNRTPWRGTPEPLDHAELARLLPAPGDPDLPDDRRRLLEEQLMREIQQNPGTAAEPRVRPVRRALYAGVPLTAAALVGALLTGVLNGDDPGSAVDLGSTEKVAAAISRISTAAEQRKVPEPRPGQYIYMKSTVSHLSSSSSGGAEVMPPRKRETWRSPDGTKGHLIEPGAPGSDDLSLDDPKARPNVSSPSYDYLKTLPTDPGTLLKKIYKDTKGQGNSADGQAFTTIGDLLREQIAPAKLSAALYRAAGKIPGVVVVEHAKDAAGRDGMAIARNDEREVSRTEWIFDRKSHAYLGERTVQLKDAFGVEAGTVTGNSAVLESAVVDAKHERPGDKKG
ncbi:CU044_5270 family protein [Streptomyces jumonjinensis]|uniref:CU044_5270 family protein n=1 Tax=Streptomyces jumonjinensis TaxID=1945 RepID=UPI00379452D7